MTNNPSASTMPEGPRTFGVVTPSLNAELYLAETLRSVWSQTQVEIDHVIVDGGSTDRTLEIAAGFPSRVVVSQDDDGMYDAINKGMAQVEGDILGYMNADDEIAPDALALVAAAFGRNPDAQWLFGTVEYIDGEGQVIGRLAPLAPSLRAYLGIRWSPIPQQTVWMRRSFFERVGPFDTGYRNCGDYDWYARALKLARPIVLPSVLGRFRLHEGQISLDLEKMDRESRMVRERHGGTGAVPFILGKTLSLRLNARNPGWFVAKRTGRISFEPR
jgi:glycosyltransferase involved in cell wall biosynthesis